MAEPMVPRPAPAFIATVTSLIRLAGVGGDDGGAEDPVGPLADVDPGEAGILAVEHRAVDLRERLREVSIAMPFARASASYIPTWAISGSV